MTEKLLSREQVDKRGFIGEFLGTLILVFFGCGSVACSVLFDFLAWPYAVPIVWGVAVTVAIYVTQKASGAHLNPAITLAFAVEGMFSWAKVPKYLLAQALGASVAAGLLYGCLAGDILALEKSHLLNRQTEQGVLTARFFGEYYPNPALEILEDEQSGSINKYFAKALLAEFFGTGILSAVIFSLVRASEQKRLKKWIPLTVGVTLTFLIIIFSPYSMAGFNPARDLMPRLFSSAVGWEHQAFAYNGSWQCINVYVLAPIFGAILGASLTRKGE